jgi:hypothetical protein
MKNFPRGSRDFPGENGGFLGEFEDYYEICG